MSVLSRIGSVAAALFVSCGLAIAAGPSGQSSGNCSPNFVQTEVGGNITLNCGAGREDLKKIQDALNALVKQNKMSSQQTRQLLALMNELLAVKSLVGDVQREQRAQSEKLDQILAMLQSGSSPDAAVEQARGLVKETLAKTQQKIGQLKVTLTRMEGSAGQISIYFQVVNEGVQDIKMMLFGPGSYGNGGSTIVAKGQEILASAIDVGGQTGRGFAVSTFIPGVPLNGRVDFRAHVDVNDVQVLRLAFAQGNLRPQGRALFQLAD